MHATQSSPMTQSQIKSFERNRYFYGKLLDAYHFELETNYHNAKRWLINRLVLGYGVICGLDVTCGPTQDTIVVSPGVAFDKWGREVIIPKPKEPIQIPQHVIEKAIQLAQSQGSQQQKTEVRACVQVMICYHECETDPVPILAGDCNSVELCAPGVIREKYRIEFTEKCDRPSHDPCQTPRFVSGGKIDHAALAKWVTQEKDCLKLPKDPCIRLAHIYLTKDGRCDPNIDITVRPVVYGNDLLFEILLDWQDEPYGSSQK